MRNSIFTLLLVWCCQSAWGDDFSFPNYLQNNANPFVRIHGLPGYVDVSQTESGQILTDVNIEITNEFHQQIRSDEEINLDYERAQLNLNFSYGINDDLSVGLLLPYISNSGGFLDGVIENWHDLFGLPQGGREEAPRDKFDISYRNSQTNLLVENTGSGIGDIALFLDKQLIVSEGQKLQMRAQLKLPTGDEDQLFGSGGYGASLSLHGSKQLSEKWHSYGTLGISYLTEGDVLEDQQENIVGNAVLGMAWYPKPKLRITAQLDLNSQVYQDTDLDALNGKAGVLNISTAYRISDNTSLFLGFNEDVINKDAAPDFGINFGFQYRH